MSVTEKLPSKLYDDALDVVIRDNFGYTKYSVEVRGALTAGENYMGIISKAIVTKTSDDDNLVRSIIVKLSPQNKARRDEFGIPLMYERETLMYNTILPIFKQFQKDKRIENEDEFTGYAKCYKILQEPPNEALYLEDLNESGYEMFDRHQMISVEHVRVAMRTLGKFHAISMAMKEQRYAEFEPFTKIYEFFEPSRDDDGTNKFWEHAAEGAINTLKPVDDQNVIEKLKKIFSTKPVLHVLLDTVSCQGRINNAVVCHGDCWNNNFMYKYKDGRPVDVKIIDWQNITYTSPATDLMLFILCCTDKEMRAEHYEEFLKIYHENLSEHLKRLDCDPEKLFPYTALLKEIKEYGIAALISTFILLCIILKESKDVPDIDEQCENYVNGGESSILNIDPTNERFIKRMRDNILDMDRYGCLNL